MLVRSTLLRKRACKLTLHALLRPVLRQERGIPADDVFLRLAYYVQGVPNSKSNARSSWSEKYIWRNIFVNYQSLIIQTCPDLCSINQKKKPTNLKSVEQQSIHRFSNERFLILLYRKRQSITPKDPIYSPLPSHLHKIFFVEKRERRTRPSRFSFFARFGCIDHRQRNEKKFALHSPIRLSFPLDNEWSHGSRRERDLVTYIRHARPLPFSFSSCTQVYGNQIRQRGFN